MQIVQASSRPMQAGRESRDAVGVKHSSLADEQSESKPADRSSRTGRAAGRRPASGITGRGESCLFRKACMVTMKQNHGESAWDDNAPA